MDDTLAEAVELLNYYMRYHLGKYRSIPIACFRIINLFFAVCQQSEDARILVQSLPLSFWDAIDNTKDPATTSEELEDQLTEFNMHQTVLVAVEKLNAAEQVWHEGSENMAR